MEKHGHGGRSSQLRRARRRRARETRRRRLGALGVVAGLAAIAGAITGAGGDDGAPAPAGTTLPAPCLGSGGEAFRRLAGQRLVVRTDGTPDGALLRRARRGEIAGVIVFPGEGLTEERIRTGLRKLQRAAASGGQPPLVIATDQEGGPVARFPEGPPLRAPLDLGRSGDVADSRLEGQATGNFLRKLGINTDLAPVLDVPASPDAAISLRAFGRNANDVARLGLAFASGLGQERVLATAKHFPGLGRSQLNTDFSPSRIDASRRELRDDLRPFRAAIADGIPLVMIANAAYPALGSDGPAALSRGVVTGLLRERLGFGGVAISDDLEAGAISASLDAPEAGEQAAAAGVDLLLFATTAAPRVHERLARALALERLSLESARESCARVVALRQGLG